MTHVNTTLLTIEEAAVYCRLAKSTLYKLTSSRKLPYYKPGGKKVYFRRDDLDEYLKMGRVSSQADLARAAEAHERNILRVRTNK
jgi:excisionase family DNA binding protein